MWNVRNQGNQKHARDSNSRNVNRFKHFLFLITGLASKFSGLPLRTTGGLTEQKVNNLLCQEQNLSSFWMQAFTLDTSNANGIQTWLPTSSWRRTGSTSSTCKKQL